MIRTPFRQNCALFAAAIVWMLVLCSLSRSDAVAWSSNRKVASIVMTMRGGGQQVGDATLDTDKNDGLVAIIIGAGPSGLACALALSNDSQNDDDDNNKRPLCRKIYLVEKHPEFDRRGSTFGLAPHGQRVLEELDCSGALRSKLQESGISTAQNIKLPNLKGNDDNQNKTMSGDGTLVFVWWELRDILLECCRQRPNVEILMGESFTDIIDDKEDEDGIRVIFAHSELELQGDFVVAADGVNSNVREYMGLPPVLSSNTTNFRGSLDVPSSASPELHALLDKGIVPMAVEAGQDMYFVLFNFHSKKPGRLAWILATQRNVETTGDNPASISRANVQDPAQLDLLEEIFALSAPHHLQPYPKASVVDFSDEVLARVFSDGGWGGRGRVTFIGDAAHGMRPTDGYGGSMAFEDAVVLAKRLNRSNDKSAKTLPTVLKQYEQERRPRVKRVYDNQHERYRLRMQEGKRPGTQDPAFLEWLFAGI